MKTIFRKECFEKTWVIDTFFVVLSSGLSYTAFAKSLAALDEFDLYTVQNLSSNETAELGFEPGAVGCEARTLSIVLCGILHVICIYLKHYLVIFLFNFPFIF